ncbi:tRNA delta(2)-isopentenylpyrophosphate transferase [Nitrococcus mobilis Nb-231]|uniref:tRNA dimethylallyltransferase n=2 Tax=Nitrococcus mobilis TaxID=35797 RepID=A4BLP3_9GAMM|nr:tRNA delta(2)-isopentenylpyrophosphate transferase [Nitrococcus mobilis Nb-231]
MGPTASGKTAVAVELVAALPCEIISVDSALVYREMNIGTAKPSAETLAIAPHQLIDIRDPAQCYSAAEFRDEALSLIKAIHARGRIPLLVGGSMLYFRALVGGLADLPAADQQLRASLEREAQCAGWPALHGRLARLDAKTAARLHPNDAQRIQRALEVYELTGETLSDLTRRHASEQLPFPLIKFVMAPAMREVLHRRIEARFRRMLASGFVDEVAELRGRGDLDLSKPSMRAVGYRQIWRHLEGSYDYNTMIACGVSATRQFAKRQLTWLRRERGAEWFDANGPYARVVARLKQRLDTVLG